MHFTLSRPPDIDARLKEQSNRTCRCEEDLALEALREPLHCASICAAAASSEESLREFDAWVGHRKTRNPDFDELRDHIDPDRR